MANRYQLIDPYINDKIYEGYTINKGAKKCYNDIKKSGKNVSKFRVRNIDNGEVFDFNIHSKHQMEGGMNILKLPKNINFDELSNIKLNEKINKLENRIQEIEHSWCIIM
jgi:hypothetical protein